MQSTWKKSHYGSKMISRKKMFHHGSKMISRKKMSYHGSKMISRQKKVTSRQENDIKVKNNNGWWTLSQLILQDMLDATLNITLAITKILKKTARHIQLLITEPIQCHLIFLIKFLLHDVSFLWHDLFFSARLTVFGTTRTGDR